MANTYTQLQIHFVFAVKYRSGLILPAIKNEFYKYITGLFQQNNHKMLAINGMPDHIHACIGLNPNQSIAEIIRLVKGKSSEWINNQNIHRGKFAWQEGYGAFSVSRSGLDAVVKYINNQEQHHQRKTFGQEYKDLLREFGIEFNDHYIFKDPE